MTQSHKAVGIGAAVQRVEDRRHVTGCGVFVDDLKLPEMAFAYIVRSPHAHARILSIDTAAALASPGVLAVLTGRDVLSEKLGSLRCGSFPNLPAGAAGFNPVQSLLATDKVRHVGDRVAVVVAESVYEAKDAAAKVEIQYEALPAAILADALDADAPKVWDNADSNLSFMLEFGDAEEWLAHRLAAAHIAKVSFHYPRASANTLEPRAAIAFHDVTDGRLTLCSSTQNPYRLREAVANVLGISQSALRVRALDVGGSFGMKGQSYPEDILMVWACSKLKRPVKWCAERTEAMSSDMHGRHQIVEAELALDHNGRAIALRTNVRIDLGAYLSHSAGAPPLNAGVSYPGPYDIPCIHSQVHAVMTNTSQLGPYRGSGKPEASFTLERLMDIAAREMNIDPIELRRRNLIPASKAPYATPAGYLYDSYNFAAILDATLSAADLPGFPQRRVASEQAGFRRGLGMALHCHRAGNGSERMEVRVDQNGRVSLYLGTLSTGQGHETLFTQMVEDWLHVPMKDIAIFQGDTDKMLFGRGSYSQRSTSTGGSALKLAVDAVTQKGVRLAAIMLGVSETEIEFNEGAFHCRGANRFLTLKDVAGFSYRASGLPQDLSSGLDGVGVHNGPNTYPNGCMICEVEVDPQTGVINVVRLIAADDVGVVVNPHMLEGQLYGSIAQGLGEALMEQVVYEAGSGQLLTGSFLDYSMPRAQNMPEIISVLAPVPTTTNLIGSKGGAEAGNVAVPAAIINATLDALGPLGVTDLPIPATPARVWRAIQQVAPSHAH